MEVGKDYFWTWKGRGRVPEIRGRRKSIFERVNRAMDQSALSKERKPKSVSELVCVRLGMKAGSRMAKAKLVFQKTDLRCTSGSLIGRFQAAPLLRLWANSSVKLIRSVYNGQ